MKSKKKIGLGAAVVLALTLLAPAQASYATEFVACDGRSDVLRITTEDHYIPLCLHGSGEVVFPYNFWVSKISTGDTAILWEADGNWQYLPARTVLTFPTVGTVRLHKVVIG